MGIRNFINSAIHKAENIFHNVENTAKTVAKTAPKVVTTAKQFDSAVKNMTNHFVQDVAKPLVQTRIPLPPTPPKPKSLWDKITNAGKNFVDGVKNFGNNAINNVKSFANRAIDGIKNFGGKVFDGVKNFANAAMERIGDAGKSLFDGVVGTVRGIGMNLFEAGGNIVKGLGNILNPSPLGKLFQGDFKGAFSEFGKNLWNGAKEIGTGLVKGLLQTPADAFLFGGGKAISAIQTLLGVEGVGRKLNDTETAELKKIFGDSVDYSQIRLKEDKLGLFNLIGAPFTHGNTIYIPKGWIPDKNDPNYQTKMNDLLAHEVGHVWQFQNGGTDYLTEAIGAQIDGITRTGNRNAGYDFELGIKEGKQWKDLNPEQQAELLSSAYEAGFYDSPNARFVYNGTDYTDYLNEALKQVRNGQGAP